MTIYNPFTNSWSRAGQHDHGSRYQTSVTLSDGLTFTIGDRSLEASAARTASP